MEKIMFKTFCFALTAFLLAGCSEAPKEKAATNTPAPAVEAKVAASIPVTGNTVSIKITDMDCSGCAKKVHKALDQFPGIKAVNVDLKTTTVNIEISDAEKFSLDKTVAQLKEVGGFKNVTP